MCNIEQLKKDFFPLEVRKIQELFSPEMALKIGFKIVTLEETSKDGKE